MVERLFLVVAGTAAIACAGKKPETVPAPAPTAAVKARDPDEREAFWSDTIRQWNTLSRGWNRIPGRYGTGCAHDTLYAFKVRPGLTDKVMIFLNGGGMCWRSGQCDPRKPASAMTSDDRSTDLSIADGILDVKNEKNPVRDWTLIFVPYCTGDVHLGSNEVVYERPGTKGDAKSFKIRHGGAANLEAVMDWVFVNLKRPNTVFVAGVDAGAVASPVVAARMARHYRNARVVQLGDGAGAYRGDSLPTIMGVWGSSDYLHSDPTYRSLDSAQFNFQQLYVAGSRAVPRVRFAQVNFSDDATQASLLPALGYKGPYARALASNLSELRTQASWFHSYTLPGKGHEILRTDVMYKSRQFMDWLSSLLNGADVGDPGSTR